MDLGDPSLQPIRVLGQGAFGRVFLCKLREGKKERNVCVKRIIVRDAKVEMKSLQEEVYIISQLKHPHIVGFIRSFVHASTVNIVMELAHGTLASVIERSNIHNTAIPKVTVMRYFLDILMGLEYVHIRHVIHSDIKPANLLITTKDRIQIADFGISAIHTPSQPTAYKGGTLTYTAPENMRENVRCVKFDAKSDIWSLGCVLYEMCMGQNPFKHAKDKHDLEYLIYTLTRQKFNCQHIAHSYGSTLANACEHMLVYDPHRRYSLADIICMDPDITLPYYQQYFEYKY